MAGHMHDFLESGGLGGLPRKLHVHNRTKVKADALVERGAIWCVKLRGSEFRIRTLKSYDTKTQGQSVTWYVPSPASACP